MAARAKGARRVGELPLRFGDYQSVEFCLGQGPGCNIPIVRPGWLGLFTSTWTNLARNIMDTETETKVRGVLGGCPCPEMWILTMCGVLPGPGTGGGLDSLPTYGQSQKKEKKNYAKDNFILLLKGKGSPCVWVN